METTLDQMTQEYRKISDLILKTGLDRHTGMIDHDKPGIAELCRRRDQIARAIRAAQCN